MSAVLDPPAVAVFGPDPLLSVTIEARGGDDDVHVHPAGQGVWVTRMAAELGAWPILCSLFGGEPGAVLEPLLGNLPGELRLARSAGPSGSYVVDRRAGERTVLASALQRHESRQPARTGRRAGLRKARGGPTARHPPSETSMSSQSSSRATELAATSPPASTHMAHPAAPSAAVSSSRRRRPQH